MRSSRDDVDSDGIVRNGFDYAIQVWVENYVCLGVGSGRVYEGQDIRNVPGHETRASELYGWDLRTGAVQVYR